MTEYTFKEVIKNPLVQEWVQGHRLGLAATMLLDGTPNLNEQGKAMKIIEECLSVPEAWLSAYPLFTLEQLVALAGVEDSFRRPPDWIRGKAVLLEETLNKLKNISHSKQRFCFVRAVEHVQQIVFHSNWSAPQILRLIIANRIAGRGYRDQQILELLEESLVQYLNTLRSPWSVQCDTLARVKAVVELEKIFDIHASKLALT